MDEFKVNDKVTIVGKNLIGTIVFIGNTSFSKDLWLWVILDEPAAKNYDGVWYFKCGKDHGIFAHPSQVEKVSFLPPASEVQSTSSRKYFRNYLRYDSLMKLKEKQDTCEKKGILQEKVRKDKTLKSTSIPSSSPDGDVILNDNISEVKPKSITHSENHLTDKQLSQQEKDVKVFSSNKGTKMQACELKCVALKTSKGELNEESPPEKEVRKVSSLKQYSNYLKDNSLPKPNAKHDRYTKKNILLKEVREDITLKSTRIPFFAPDGDVILDDYKFEVKPKSIPHSEKYLSEKQQEQEFSQQEMDSSLNKGTEMQDCELRDVTLKSSNELNEVNNDILNLGRKSNNLKQFSQEKKEPKNSSDTEVRMQAFDLSKTKDDVLNLDRKTETLKHLPEKRFSHQESKDSSDEVVTTETHKPMISKASKRLFYFSPSICLTVLGLSIALFFLHTYVKY